MAIRKSKRVNVEIIKNVKDCKIYMLSYDISENHVEDDEEKTSWEELFAILADEGFIELNRQHLFQLTETWDVFMIRPAKSTWIFFSKYSLDEIALELGFLRGSGLLFGISEIKPQDDVIASINIDVEFQEEFDAKIDEYLENYVG